MTDPTDFDRQSEPSKGGIKRTEPEWHTDFGPEASRLKRALWAVVCMAVVIGFLVAALSLGKPTKPAASATSSGIPVWVYFVLFSIFLLVISLTGEKIALRIKAKMGWDKNDEL